MDKLESNPDITSYRYVFHFILLTVLIGIIYSNTIFQEWHFDDYPNIVNNKGIYLKNITFDSILNTFLKSGGYNQDNFSRPIPRVTFALNYYLTGLNTFGFHLTNIFIHIVTAFFVYLVFQRTLKILKTREGIQFNAITIQDIALLGTVLWAIHPLQTQAVTYIVQRMASMAAMFYLMAMFFYIQGRLKQGELQKVLYFITSFVCWISAFLSKENAVLLPLSIIAYEVIFFGIKKEKLFYMVGLFSLFALAVAFILLFTRGGSASSFYEAYSILEDKIIKPYEHRPFTMMERLLTEPRILVWYLFLIICPLSDFLSLESDIVVSSGLFHPISTFTSILFILSLILFSIAIYKKLKLVSYAILFFLINHILESSFLGLELYFEHRNYLSSMFIYLVLSYGLVKLHIYYYRNNSVLMHYLVASFIISILVSEGNATYLRNDIWETEETLHLDNILKAPNNIRPRITLSSYYIKQGKRDEALNLLREAEAILHSGSARVQKNWIGMLYHNIGSNYYERSEFEIAKTNLLKSLEYDQYSWETHALLGIIFFMEKEIDQSVKAYINAVTLNFSDAKLFNMFGRALYASGEFNMALEAFDKGLQLAKEQQQHGLVKTIKFNIISCYLALEDTVSARNIFISVENYFEETINKLSLNHQDDIRIIQKTALDNDIIYLLYKSILYAETSNQSIQKIIDHIMSSGNEYCQIINEIKENKMVGIIYPTIDEIEEDISNLYYEQMQKLIKNIEEKMLFSSSGCSLTEESPEDASL